LPAHLLCFLVAHTPSSNDAGIPPHSRPFLSLALIKESFFGLKLSSVIPSPDNCRILPHKFPPPRISPAPNQTFFCSGPPQRTYFSPCFSHNPIKGFQQFIIQSLSLNSLSSPRHGPLIATVLHPYTSFSLPFFFFFDHSVP